LARTKFYSGEVEYQTTFNFSAEKNAKKIILYLGELHESAEIFVNGSLSGSVWTEPSVVDITDKVKQGKNVILIKVRNLMANRIIHLDRTGMQWKKYFFVNIDYKPFDASNWELLPSGLIGPVRIISQTNIQ